jgi:hypothetical protein
MAKSQDGQLIWRNGSWHARLYAEVDGERIRVRRKLDTDNKAVARRKLARLVRAANPSHQEAERAETFEEAARRVMEGQQESVKTWRERLSRLEHYAFPHIAKLPVGQVRGAGPAVAALVGPLGRAQARARVPGHEGIEGRAAPGQAQPCSGAPLLALAGRRAPRRDRRELPATERHRANPVR